jgi:hypothetical protein
MEITTVNRAELNALIGEYGMLSIMQYLINYATGAVDSLPKSTWTPSRTEGDGMYVNEETRPPFGDWEGHQMVFQIPEDLPQAAAILTELFPEWWELFKINNRKYADVPQLGIAGVFPDINRKVGALRSRLWDGDETPDGAESTERIISDLIGHLFLAWLLHRQDMDGVKGQG